MKVAKVTISAWVPSLRVRQNIAVSVNGDASTSIPGEIQSTNMILQLYLLENDSLSSDNYGL